MISYADEEEVLLSTVAKPGASTPRVLRSPALCKSHRPSPIVLKPREWYRISFWLTDEWAAGGYRGVPGSGSRSCPEYPLENGINIKRWKEAASLQDGGYVKWSDYDDKAVVVAS